MKLNAILLGLSLERLSPPAALDGRLVRTAEAALTILQGAGQLAAAAPGFVEPFNVVSACAQLADLDLGDYWPARPMVPQSRADDAPWAPVPAPDALRGGPARLTGDGVVAVLGLHRLAALEEAVRGAAPGDQVTAALVTGDPAELVPLGRLVVADFLTCLRQAFPPSAWPRLQLVWDEQGTLAAAAGVPAVSDATESAVRIANGRVVKRAEGFGACHTAATTQPPSQEPPSRRPTERGSMPSEG
jgi:hypothetical protein